MRKAYAIVSLVICLGAAAGAQAAQGSATNQPAQNQASSETLSPQAQAKLMEQIHHALIMLPYYGVFDSLGYRLQGRTVILEGRVVSLNLKPDAEAAVKKIEGVEKVINNIQMLPPAPLDDRIRRSVYRVIYDYGPFLKYKENPNPPIRIIVQNARVTLEGVVDTETDKNLCTLRVKQVPSVLSVTNNLRVMKPI
ncbi:MAG TPA: BON domain-containing protein [Terriglobales bacterium]|nr:BON domain-containing protein [Terriglobales bacterium]